MLDYTEESKVIVFDWSEGKVRHYDGLVEIRKLYAWLLEELVDKTLQAPAQEVQQGMGWLLWKNPERGFVSGTDTFVYDEHHRVKYQNTVCTRTPGSSPPPDGCKVETATRQLEALLAGYHPTSDAEAFEHHAKAFVQEKNLEHIMLDYTEESKVILYDWSEGEVRHYHGLAEIKKLYAWLLEELVDKTLQAPASDVQPGMGWLLWKNPERGFVSGTDPFVYDEHHRIKYQNTVCTRTPGSSPPPDGCKVETATRQLPALLAGYRPTSDAEAFAHH